MIDTATYQDYRARIEAYRAWLGDRTSYHAADAEAAGHHVTNDMRSAVEVYEFHADPPERYFLYINVTAKLATTWTGERLGRVEFGREYRDNFGGTRVPITMRADNGRLYYGTYFKSAGDYARVRLAKRRRPCV